MPIPTRVGVKEAIPMTTYLLTSRTFTLRQPATASKYHIFQAAIAASADGIALSARSPLTVEGMAGYAGVMTTFTGTDDDDFAHATIWMF